MRTFNNLILACGLLAAGLLFQGKTIGIDATMPASAAKPRRYCM